MSKETPTGNNDGFMIKVFFIVALYSSFVFSGVYEEKLYKGTYSPSNESPDMKIKFSHPLLAILCNSIVAYAISALVLNSMSKSKKTPFESNDKILLGSFYITSRICAENSLSYLDFISKIIGKSCKSVSIIIIYFMYNLPLVGAGLKKLINQQSKDNVHTHGWSDFVKVVITTTAILLFNSEEGVKYFLILKGSGSSKGDLLTSIFLGYGLLVISLFFDGLMGLKEKIINHEVHHNPEYKEYKKCLSWEYMRLFSFYTILFGVVGVLYQLAFNDLIGTIKVYLSSKELIFDILSYSFLSAVGQIFLFQFLEKYGPLTLSIITGVRKILTIAISIIYFGKAISIIKVVSLILGTTVIGWEVFEKASKGHNKTH